MTKLLEGDHDQKKRQKFGAVLKLLDNQYNFFPYFYFVCSNILKSCDAFCVSFILYEDIGQLVQLQLMVNETLAELYQVREYNYKISNVVKIIIFIIIICLF